MQSLMTLVRSPQDRLDQEDCGIAVFLQFREVIFDGFQVSV